MANLVFRQPWLEANPARLDVVYILDWQRLHRRSYDRRSGALGRVAVYKGGLTMKKTVLLTGTILLMTGPAYCEVIPFGNGGSFTQAYLVQYQLEGFPQPFRPIYVGYNQPHTVGEVIDPNATDPTVVATSQPITIIDAPITITDSSGDSVTFNAAVSTIALAVDVAAYFGAPLNELALTLSVMTFVADTYGPVSNAVYDGVNNFAVGVINAGISAMNSGAVPIGPDPLFSFDFAIGATDFRGAFDAFGDINDISGIHNVSLFVDGIRTTGAVIPEPATWIMLIVGFTSLLVRRISQASKARLIKGAIYA